MSRTERERREQEARRARRLAERAEQRAERKAEQARRAAERADKLAERARKRPARDQGQSFEDRVDEFAENWERKAEAWFEEKAERFFDSGAGESDDQDSELATARANRRRADRNRTRAEGRRRRRRPSRKQRTFRSRFNSGRGLYRDKQRGKICGVCAGTAEYLDVETWQVRLVAVLGLIFVPSVAIPTYFIAYFLMDDRPYYRRMTDRFEDDDEMETEEVETGPPSQRDKSEHTEAVRPRPPEMSNAEAFRTAKQKFADLEERLRSMESHVTSSKFELQRELRKISGDDS